METRSNFASIGELDQLREFASGAQLEIVQLSPGQMTGVLAHCDLGRSSVHLNRLSLPSRGRGVLSDDRWTFVVFPQTTQGRFNSIPLSSEILLAYPPNSEFEGTIASRFHDWIFTVDLEDLAKTHEALFHSEMSIRSRSVQFLRLEPAAAQALRTLASRNLERTQHDPRVVEDANSCLQLHEQTLEVLAASIHSASGGVGRTRRTQTSRWQIVRRAEDFMREYADQPISLTTLCDLTKTSERSLRRAFQDVIGVSPMHYLASIRMQRVRTALEDSTVSSRTVASVAMRWEFAHLGRFARSYQRFFGELPSETLSKSVAEYDR